MAWGGCDALVQCLVYWLLGQLEDEPDVLARFAGIYKAVQSAGAAASWALAASPSVKASTQAWINVGLFVTALPPAALLVMRTPALAGPAHPAHPPKDSLKDALSSEVLTSSPAL